ncbi:hypothetical protein [Nitrococcus mobilis]|uniref:hypothetical protein n=1 Tax=Nitrococcus mobilis TaxID=35797 RepID=UPI000310CDEE|nr:hypothetical protein [Nitrococcus mobilis]
MAAIFHIAHEETGEVIENLAHKTLRPGDAARRAHCADRSRRASAAVKASAGVTRAHLRVSRQVERIEINSAASVVPRAISAK